MTLKGVTLDESFNDGKGTVFMMSCGHACYEFAPNFCPVCGATVVKNYDNDWSFKWDGDRYVKENKDHDIDSYGNII